LLKFRRISALIQTPANIPDKIENRDGRDHHDRDVNPPGQRERRLNQRAVLKQMAGMIDGRAA